MNLLDVFVAVGEIFGIAPVNTPSDEARAAAAASVLALVGVGMAAYAAGHRDGERSRRVPPQLGAARVTRCSCDICRARKRRRERAPHEGV